MKTITTGGMREIDRLAADEFELPGKELMQRAGHGVAVLVERLCDRHHLMNPFIQLIAGRGKNGGDAFVAARILREDGHEVELLLAGNATDIRGDALAHFSKMRAAGVPFREITTKEAWDEALDEDEMCHILVDGVLGIGIHGPPRGPAAGAIDYINALSVHALVVSIDVPSGLDADAGTAPGAVVTADLTATIGLPKKGMLMPEALPLVGAVEVIPLGIPDELIKTLPTGLELLTISDVAPNLPRRARAAHKGDFGHLLAIGGAAGYAGAIALTGRAALRSGAGLVSVLTPHGVVPLVAGTMLEVMTHGGPETETGSLCADGWNLWIGRLAEFQAVAAGPGLTRHAESAKLVDHLLKTVTVPMVLDADALFGFAGHPEKLQQAAGPVVITPHPGELARLLGWTVEKVQAGRVAAATRAAELTHAVVVLKGAGTLVAAHGTPTLFVNLNGNPGMATGGMGDALTGLIGGLLAQGLAPFAAACAGVYVHGLAGDCAAAHHSQAGLTAGDVIEEITNVLRDIQGR